MKPKDSSSFPLIVRQRMESSMRLSEKEESGGTHNVLDGAFVIVDKKRYSNVHISWECITPVFCFFGCGLLLIRRI